MVDDRIGHLFPAGGPVPPELVIGRDGDIDEVHRRVTEGIHTMLTGERRIGKTTVCNAVCERLRQAGSTVVQILGELVDLYSGRDEVVLLVDGSSERALERMMGAPIGFGKLVDRLQLTREISTGIWRESLPDRFGQAGLELGSDALDALISFGEGRPYATMSAARYSALNARKLGIGAVEKFDVREGIAEARRHLEEDS
jgi:hypothetical protein